MTFIGVIRGVFFSSWGLASEKLITMISVVSYAQALFTFNFCFVLFSFVAVFLLNMVTNAG